jgi:hypothetical protein
LSGSAHVTIESRVVVPIVLIERIFDSDDRVFLDEIFVELDQLVTGEDLSEEKDKKRE